MFIANLNWLCCDYFTSCVCVFVFFHVCLSLFISLCPRSLRLLLDCTRRKLPENCVRFNVAPVPIGTHCVSSTTQMFFDCRIFEFYFIRRFVDRFIYITYARYAHTCGMHVCVWNRQIVRERDRENERQTIVEYTFRVFDCLPSGVFLNSSPQHLFQLEYGVRSSF